MTLRTVNYELEAKLTGPSSAQFSRPSGKVERKSYTNGDERLKISVRNLTVSDQLTAIVRVDGEEIARFSLTNDSGRLDNEDEGPDSMSALEVGQTIEVYLTGNRVLSEVLQLD